MGDYGTGNWQSGGANKVKNGKVGAVWNALRGDLWANNSNFAAHFMHACLPACTRM